MTVKNVVKNVILTDNTGQWFVRKTDLWNKPTYYSDKPEAPKFLGFIALNPKFCDRNSSDEKAVFASEDEALAFAEKHFPININADNGTINNDRPRKLHIIYINSDGHLTWDKPL